MLNKLNLRQQKQTAQEQSGLGYNRKKHKNLNLIINQHSTRVCAQLR